MNVLVMNCSPVRNGATAAIASMIADRLSETVSGIEIQNVCIEDYQFAFCRGCRKCHTAAACFQQDGVQQLMERFEQADVLVFVSPSYWADVPAQFKAFIDRCTPWCNTHEPHAELSKGKKGFAVALRTGPGMKECERIIGTIEHFLGHLEIECSASLGLCGVEDRGDALERKDEILAFCGRIGDEISRK